MKEDASTSLSEPLLGRLFQAIGDPSSHKDTNKKRALVYIGSYDPYGDEDNCDTAPSLSKLVKFVVPNSQFDKIVFSSPEHGGELTDFTKGHKIITKRYSNIERVNEA